MATAASMKENGVPFTGDPHLIAKLPDREIWLAEFRDPDGSAVALMSEVET